MLPVTIVHLPAGGTAVELTPIVNTVRFDTAAVGGFGSLEASLPGDVRRRLAYLGATRVYWGDALLWEGQLEDIAISLAGGDLSTTIRCFGLRRKLEEVTLRRVWSKRDWDWAEYPQGEGAAIIGSGTVLRTRNLAVRTGRFDDSDYSRSGGKVSGNGVALAANEANAMFVNLTDTVALAGGGFGFGRLMATLALSGAGTGAAKMVGFLGYWNGNGATLPVVTSYTVNTSINVDLVTVSGSHEDINQVALGLRNASGGAFTPASTDFVTFEDVRILGIKSLFTPFTEDTSGGLYGGTILRDIVGLVPGLTVGIIEDGSDFTIQAIERIVRDAALSVVQEVAGYYTREWAVWDGPVPGVGRFDWRTRNLDEPQWIVPLTSLDSLELQGTTDTVAKIVYVLYTDAASGSDAQASATATSTKNPYVRQNKTKDMLVKPGFPMTTNTSAQLASTLATEVGQRPGVTGHVSLKATKMLANAVGAVRPAAMIRGGDNIVIPELPKTDPFLQGRDGETLFHVVSSDVDLTNGTVTLELEGQQSRQSVILARLAAATRTLTG
jgi:hypothetical protein